jgi:serine/threonine-protein kinase HipA
VANQNELVVWLEDVPIATLRQHRKRGVVQLSCQYTSEAEREFEPGTPLISISMPLWHRPYQHAAAARFFDGLLPEGEARAMIAYDLHVGSEDTFGLLRELGRDCAGALVIYPIGETPPQRPTKYLARPITDEEVGQRVDQLRSFPLGIDREVRVSLAGVQEKLLLTKLDDGWGLPIHGAPSTHILKPDTGRLPDGVRNEAFCLRLAKNAGIAAASCETATFGTREVLIVERFDREITNDGEIHRLHQEDSCQALGKTAKYQEAGGPTLQQIAGLLDRYGHQSDLEHLLQLITLHVFIGNADAHGKNYSLLHARNGGISLAPAYDVMSTLIFPQVSATAGMSIGGETKINSIQVNDIETEAISWGLSPHQAHSIIFETNLQLARAFEQTATEMSPPNKLRDLIFAKIAKLPSRTDSRVAENSVTDVFAGAPITGSTAQHSGQLTDSPMCAMLTKTGHRCPWHALPGGRYCGHHINRQ